ncbi:MAG: hypothetical protein IJL66_07400 [Lachnospiraceae bacterium]|nr:hypothetical protein [Lachnospiraceae bacterium]
MADGTWHAGEEITLPEPAFTAPEGKVFAGWASVEEKIPPEDCLYDKKNKEYAYTYGGLAAKDMRALTPAGSRPPRPSS